MKWAMFRVSSPRTRPTVDTGGLRTLERWCGLSGQWEGLFVLIDLANMVR